MKSLLFAIHEESVKKQEAQLKEMRPMANL